MFRQVVDGLYGSTFVRPEVGWVFVLPIKPDFVDHLYQQNEVKFTEVSKKARTAWCIKNSGSIVIWVSSSCKFCKIEILPLAENVGEPSTQLAGAFAGQ